MQPHLKRNQIKLKSLPVLLKQLRLNSLPLIKLDSPKNMDEVVKVDKFIGKSIIYYAWAPRHINIGPVYFGITDQGVITLYITENIINVFVIDRVELILLLNSIIPESQSPNQKSQKVPPEKYLEKEEKLLKIIVSNKQGYTNKYFFSKESNQNVYYDLLSQTQVFYTIEDKYKIIKKITM